MAGPSDEVFKCDYCPRTFNTKRARGGHLKAHRHLRPPRQAAASVRRQPPQQQPNTNTCRELALAAPQPRPQGELLALPAPNTNRAVLVTNPQQQPPQPPRLENVFFRCCCGVTEKIPNTRSELMERGTYEGGSITMNCQHQGRPSEEIEFLNSAPPANATTVGQNPGNVDVVNEENDVDLTLRM